ncbi:MAG: Uma2 family endonuclease [Polyangiales bacterium]
MSLSSQPPFEADAHAVVGSRFERQRPPMTQARKRVELTFEVPYSHPSWVLEDEQVPISAVQDEATRVLDSVWRAWSRRTGRAVGVRRDLAIRWDEEHPRIGVDPDVCLLEPPPATAVADLRSLRTWREGDEAPKVVCEVVSHDNAEKDYFVGPRKYAAAGVQELWVFDPQRFGPDDDGGPWVLQVWERGKAGDFRRVYVGDGPAWSAYFQSWLVVKGDGMLLRIADDEEGTRLWPTEAEAGQAEAERARTEAATARAEAATALTEAATARAEADALREKMAELHAQLAALRAAK